MASVEHGLPEPTPPLWWPERSGRRLPGYDVIGRGLECLFGVDKSGRVWLVDPEEILPRYFVNSSVDQFIRAFARFRPAWQALGSDEEAGDLVVTLVAEIAELDPAACSSDENYWPVVLEQVGYGLL